VKVWRKIKPRKELLEVGQASVLRTEKKKKNEKEGSPGEGGQAGAAGGRGPKIKSVVMLKKGGDRGNERSGGHSTFTRQRGRTRKIVL